MLMLPEPLGRALESVGAYKKRVIYVTPSGKPFNQRMARELSREEELVFICGRYEGIDQRIIDSWVDDEISIGDYVLTGGEIPACILVDCVARLTDGVLAAPECYEEESISSGMLEYPQYTRPVDYHGMQVPPVLLSGDHKKINEWRRDAALELTRRQRPDLLGDEPTEG